MHGLQRCAVLYVALASSPCAVTALATPRGRATRLQLPAIEPASQASACDAIHWLAGSRCTLLTQMVPTLPDALALHTTAALHQPHLGIRVPGVVHAHPAADTGQGWAGRRWKGGRHRQGGRLGGGPVPAAGISCRMLLTRVPSSAGSCILRRSRHPRRPSSRPSRRGQAAHGQLPVQRAAAVQPAVVAGHSALLRPPGARRLGCGAGGGQAAACAAHSTCQRCFALCQPRLLLSDGLRFCHTLCLLVSSTAADLGRHPGAAARTGPALQPAARRGADAGESDRLGSHVVLLHGLHASATWLRCRAQAAQGMVGCRTAAAGATRWRGGCSGMPARALPSCSCLTVTRLTRPPADLPSLAFASGRAAGGGLAAARAAAGAGAAHLDCRHQAHHVSPLGAPCMHMPS